MFGATVLAPLLMGFDPNVAILFSGIGTLIFFVAVGGRVPSYLGSSFSFIAVVIAATAYAGQRARTPNLGVALGGIVAAGALYAVIGVVVMLVGYAWIERLMPPVVTGSVVAVIGLNLAPIAVKGISGSGVRHVDRASRRSSPWASSPCARPASRAGCRSCWAASPATLLYALAAPTASASASRSTSPPSPAPPWIGLPAFTAPVWNAQAMALIAPVAIVLVAENLGHVKAVAAMTGRNLDPYLGRAFLGDGLATMVAGSGGGTGVTTYAENIGVMAVTKIYSTLVFVVAALTAIVLGFSPKFGALIMTIPGPVLGGLVDRRVRAHHRHRRAHLGAEPRRFLARPQPRHRGGDADGRRRRPRAEARRLHAGRHRHRDLRRDPALSAVQRRAARDRGRRRALKSYRAALARNRARSRAKRRRVPPP